jgi:hypothetical protein
MLAAEFPPKWTGLLAQSSLDADAKRLQNEENMRTRIG